LKGTDFLDLAEKLLGEKTEAANRTAVSRAYYGAFNHVNSYYRTVGVRLEKHQGNIHKTLANCLAYSGVDEIAEVCSELTSIYAERKLADYNMDSPSFRKPKKSEAALISARSCLVRFDRHKASSVKGVTAYYTKVLGYPAPSSSGRS
jgi:uncharacterized protein (UPF0332 family)